MYQDKRILALTYARGGSKGLPDKNTRELAGKPLIAWTIEEAHKSRYIDRYIVSTENKNIKDIAMQYGADVPFMRPDHLAQDDSSSMDVIRHAVDCMKDSGESFDIVVILQATSPLRRAEDIDKAIMELVDHADHRAVVSVCEADHSPLWMNTLPSDLNMSNFINREYLNKNRQEIPTYYRINGALYCSYVDYLLKNGSFYNTSTYAYLMPKERSIDIDDQTDFKYAEFILTHLY